MSTRRASPQERDGASEHQPATGPFNDPRWRVLLAHSTDGLCLVSRAGTLLHSSPATGRVLGYAPQTLGGRDLFALLQPDDRAAAQASFATSLAQPGQPITAMARLLSPDGQTRWVELVFTSHLDTPDIGAVVVNCRDVTDQQHIEHASLLRSRVLESMVEGVSIANEQGLILYTNPAEDAMFGYERGELIGQPVTVQNTYPPEENERIVREVIGQLQAKGTWQGTFSNRKKDGTPFTTFARITALEIGDRAYWVCVQEDLTERQQVEAALQSSQARLALAYQAARLGTFDWNIQTGEVVWTEEEEALYGLPPGGFGGLYGNWRQTVHPDDRERAEAEVLRAAHTGSDLDSEFRILWPDGSVRWMAAKARVVRDSSGAPAHMIGANEDITKRKRHEEGQRFLTEASAILASSLDYMLTLASVARLAVPQLADYCLVDLVADDGTITRVATVHRDPAKQAVLEQLARRYPPPTDDSYGLPLVYRDGRSAISAAIGDGQLQRAASDGEHLDLLRALTPRSAMLVPLLVRGRVIGVLTFGMSDTTRPYDEDDLKLAETLASYVAFAIDNAQLYQTEQFARTRAEATAERMVRLQMVTAQLAGALTAAEVADVVLTAGLAAVSADAGSVALLSADGAMLELIGAVGYPPAVVAASQRIPVADSSPGGDTVRAAAPIWVESRGVALERWPHLAAAHQQIDLHAWANLPLLVDGKASGAIGFGFHQQRSFSDEDQTFLLTLAHQCSQALERARLYAAEQEARAQAEAAQRRVAFLAEVSAGLTASLDYTTTLQHVARSVVPTLADACMVYVEHNHAIERVALAHRDPAQEQELRALLNNDLINPQGTNLIAHVLRTRVPAIMLEGYDARMEMRAESDAQRILAQRFPPRAYMLLPLIARDRTIGAINFALFDLGRAYTDADVSLAEEVARRAALALDNALLYRDAQQAISVRDQFLSVAAHELRTPITTLLGNAQLMQRRSERVGTLDEREQRTLGTIISQTKRLNRMVLALLDIARIDSGRLTIQRVQLDLVALVRRIVEEIQVGLDGRRVEVRAPNGPLTVEGDDLRLEQVVQNLIQNALKYSAPPAPVMVEVRESSSEIGVVVMDQGIGIPADALPNLFQRFYRAQNIDTQVSGMGIGLYVVQQIVALHGGHMEVASQEGVGSTFIAWLPRIAA